MSPDRDGVALNPGLTPSQPNRRLYELDEPAPTIAFGHDVANWQWVFERPATTIQGDFRVFSPGSHRANDGRNNELAVNRSEGTRCEPWELAVLQSFPPDFEFVGSKTAIALQIGNAVGPRMAEMLLSHVTGRAD